MAAISMGEISFFTDCRLKLHEIVEVSYWWASETSVSKTIQQTGRSSRTIVDCYNYHRDVCTQWFLDHPVQVGGAGESSQNQRIKIWQMKQL